MRYTVLGFAAVFLVLVGGWQFGVLLGGIGGSTGTYKERLYDSHAHPTAILEEDGGKFVSLMNEQGVAQSVITPWINPDGEDGETRVREINDLLSLYGDTFTPLFLVLNEEDLLTVTKDDFSRLHAENKEILHGWGEFALWGPGGEENILGPRWRDMYSYAQAHNLIVMMHPTEQHKEEMLTIVEDYPNLTLLLHGDESYAYISRLMNASDRVFFTVDTTYMMRQPEEPYLPLFDVETPEEFIQIYDANKQRMLDSALEDWRPIIEAYPGRVLWGTDIQHSWHADSRVYSRIIDFSRRFIGHLPREIQKKYAFKNAESLFDEVHETRPEERSPGESSAPEVSPHERQNSEDDNAQDVVRAASVFKDDDLIARGELIFTYDLADTVFGEQSCKEVYALFDPRGFEKIYAIDESFYFICGTEEGISIETHNMTVNETFAEFRREHGLNFAQLPLNGTWYTSQSHEKEVGGYRTTHSREGGAGEFAWDFTKLSPTAKGGYVVEEYEGGHEEFRRPNDFACDLNEWEDERCVCQNDPTVNTGGASNTDYYAFGKPIFAPASGTITLVEDSHKDNCPFGEFGEGNEVLLHLTGGYYFWFHHLRQGSVPVEEGDTVQKGEKIGEVGNSGFSLGPHLHTSLVWSGSFSEYEVEAPFSPGWSIPTVFEEGYIRPALGENREAEQVELYDPRTYDFISNEPFVQPQK